MYASTAGEAALWMSTLVRDLQELYDLEDRLDAWSCVATGPGGRWDEYGVPGIARWFDGHESRCVAEVVSIYAEVAIKLGLIDVERRYDFPAWTTAGFVDGERFRGMQLRRESVDTVVGPPSLVVDHRICCYAPENEAEGWAFLDFVSWYAGGENSLLRNVRLPRVPA
jgi:hypothetical protein